MSVGVVKEQVEISRHVAEPSEQQRNLATVVDTMVGSMLHQLAQCH